MKRWILFFLCAVLGLLALMCGLGIPAHLRATDVRVIELAGHKTPSLVEEGLQLVKEKQFDAAELLVPAAQAAGVPGLDKLRKAVDRQSRKASEMSTEPYTSIIIRTENRESALAQLGASAEPAVRELMQTRALTNVTVFSPSSSASGQAFDAAVAETGLLLKDGRLTAELSNAVVSAAAEANRGGSLGPLEQVLLDFMSLGQRLTRGQLVVFVKQIGDTETLHRLTDHARNEDLSVLYSAVEISRAPATVTHYLNTFSKDGMKDLQASLRYGAGGVRELLQRNQRLYISGEADPVALDLSLKNPRLALSLKWGLYLLGGFLFGLAVHFVWPAASGLEEPLQVRGVHVAREVLFALGFLLVVLLLSEPFLAQESQKAAFVFRLQLPTVGGVVPFKPGSNQIKFMNSLSLLTLLLFLVLQGLIYVACLVKLAEVRRQRVVARIKLRLLENEEHLFDAGLYLGFVGTIISLILVSLGVIKPSLMAAYSSTSFGIIFVSIFKIFNLRPLKRKLVLESESVIVPEPVAPANTLSAPL